MVKTWLAALALGCGPSAPTQPRPPVAPPPADAGVDAPVPLAEDPPRLARRARQLYLDWQAAFADPQLDCATATTRMNAIADANADVLEANREVLRGDRARIRALRVELDKYEAELGPVAKSIIESPVMARCASDPEFARATDRLAGEG